MQTFFIRTYGCQMNELDSEVVIGELERRGLTRTDDETEADLLIFNTCSVRDLAERKVMGKLGRLGKSSQSKKRFIGVMGCMANAKKEQLFQKFPHVDFVLGTNNLHELNTALDEVLAGNTTTSRTDPKFYQEIDYLGAKRHSLIKASVSIIRGCNKFCTYCVVPYTRGPEVSRPPKQIVEECQHLVQQGYKEITLLGQNVNSYGKDHSEWRYLFHDLLYQLDAISGLEHIRFMTSHPVDISRELMTAIRDLDSLCEFVHFPMQAGADRILRKMHRMYTIEQYLEKVALLKELVPNITLGTDIIVGFPTETDEEFEETYQRMKEIEFSVAFIFAYSPRKGTPAIRWKDDIPHATKQQRLQRLLVLQEDISQRQQQALVNTEQQVLVECCSSKDPSFLKGRTRCWKRVLFPGDATLIGSLQQVTICDYKHQTLLGKQTK